MFWTNFFFSLLLSHVPNCLPILSHHLVTHFHSHRLVTHLWPIPIIYDSFLVQVLVVLDSKNNVSLLYIRTPFSLQLGLKPDLVSHPIQVASTTFSLLSHFKCYLKFCKLPLSTCHKGASPFDATIHFAILSIGCQSLWQHIREGQSLWYTSRL